jgi:serine/threonine protein kinase
MKLLLCTCRCVPCRDLKMDNTLLDDLDPPRIKLCDFGFAKWWTDKPCMNTITGEGLLHSGAIARSSCTVSNKHACCCTACKMHASQCRQQLSVVFWHMFVKLQAPSAMGCQGKAPAAISRTTWFSLIYSCTDLVFFPEVPGFC